MLTHTNEWHLRETLTRAGLISLLGSFFMAGSMQQVIADRIADAVEHLLLKLTHEPKDVYYVLALSRVCPVSRTSTTAVSLNGEIKVGCFLDLLHKLNKSLVDSLVST